MQPAVPRSIHKLSISSSTRDLSKARSFVEAHARAADLTSSSVEEVKMCVDEACTNIIKHAYHGDESRKIDLAVIVDDDRFTVSIRDEGRSFQPEQYARPDILALARSRRAGGFGVEIMRRLMDDVEYRKVGRVNEVRLTKYRADGNPE